MTSADSIDRMRAAFVRAGHSPNHRSIITMARWLDGERTFMGLPANHHHSIAFWEIAFREFGIDPETV
jgi:hypothetical protein